MKIGIFGGSFNPPHKMHETIAKTLIEMNYVDKVIFIPTGNKYQKKDLIDFQDRFNMLKLITNKYNYFEVSDYEYKKEQVYTYETLDYYKKLYPYAEIFFICGTDNLKNLKSWKNYNYILRNYKLLVIERDNDKFQKILTSFDLWKNNIIKANIPLSNISSTYIRNELFKNNYDETLIDKKVIKYIKNHHLYETEVTPCEK